MRSWLVPTSLCAALAALVLPSQSWAKTINVPGPYGPTIQAAIDAAVDGDTVLVAPGTYPENIDFKGRAITLISSAGPAQTIIDGHKAGTVVRFATREGRDSQIDGFTITNGQAAFGAGISCTSASPTIRNNTINANTATARGGAIYADENSAPLITRNTFADNSADSVGGGINCFSSHLISIENNDFHGNHAAEGGAIILDKSWDGTGTIIANNLIWGNRADGGQARGGGIFLNTGALATLVNNTFTLNTAVSGGALHMAGLAATLENSILWGDSPQELVVSLGTLSVHYCDVQGGWPSGWGNINADPLLVDPLNDDCHLTAVSPCIDTGNPAFQDTRSPDLDVDGQPRPGHGRNDIGADEYYRTLLRVPNIYPTIQEAIDRSAEHDLVFVSPNTYHEDIDFHAKAISVFASGGPANTTIQGTGTTSVVTFDLGERNASLLRGFRITGGIGTLIGLSDERHGGGIFIGAASPLIQHCWIHDNTVNGSGGGVALEGSGLLGGFFPRLMDCVISHNAAAFHGGGVFIKPGGLPLIDQYSPELRNCIITLNTADGGGGVCADYADILDDMLTNYFHIDLPPTGPLQSGPRFFNCAINQNFVPGWGGGLYLIATNAAVFNCTVWNNIALIGGGVFEIPLPLAGGVAAYRNSIFWESQPDQIYSTFAGLFDAQYCDIQNQANPPLHNIDADPMFVDKYNGDYHLTFGSPCIDTGLNHVFGLPGLDVDGDPRILDGDTDSDKVIDMGIDEFRP